MAVHPDVKKLVGRLYSNSSKEEILASANQAERLFQDWDDPAVQPDLAAIALVRALCNLRDDTLRQDLCFKFEGLAEHMAEHGAQLALLAKWYHAVAELAWAFRDDATRAAIAPDDLDDALECLRGVVELAKGTNPLYVFLAYSLIAECEQRRGNTEESRAALVASNDALDALTEQDPVVQVRIQANARMAQVQCEGPLRFMSDYRILVGDLRTLAAAL